MATPTNKRIIPEHQARLRSELLKTLFELEQHPTSIRTGAEAKHLLKVSLAECWLKRFGYSQVRINVLVQKFFNLKESLPQ